MVREGLHKSAADAGFTLFHLHAYPFCRYLSTVHTAPFLCKNADKNIRFCAFTLLTETEEKISVSVVFTSFTILWSRQISVFVRSHYLLSSKKASVYVNIHFERRF